MPNWKPAVKVTGEDKWSFNALVFATEQEAEDNARDLMMRWMAVTDSSAQPTEDPVNYRWVGGQLVAI